MPLTNKQKRTVASAPASQKARLAASFNRQNNGGSAPRRGRGRGRGNRGRNTSRGSYSQVTRGRNISAPISQLPQIRHNTTQTTVIEKNVYVADFVGNPGDGSFTSQVFDVTPANMPFFDQFALIYGRYKFDYYKFRFVTQTATTTSGSYWIAFQPRSTAGLPTSFHDVQLFGKNIFGPLYKSTSEYMFVPKHLLKDRWFVTERTPDDGTGTVADFVDSSPGRLLFGTNGHPQVGVNTSFGFLEVQAKVIFADPNPTTSGIVQQPPTQPPPTKNTNNLTAIQAGFEALKLLHPDPTNDPHDESIVFAYGVLFNRCTENSNQGRHFTNSSAHLDFIHRGLDGIQTTCGSLNNNAHLIAVTAAHEKFKQVHDTPDGDLHDQARNDLDMYFFERRLFGVEEETYEEALEDDYQEEIVFPVLSRRREEDELSEQFSHVSLLD